MRSRGDSSAVVAAIQAYSKINAAGQRIERTEQVSLSDLFDRMSAQSTNTRHRERRRSGSKRRTKQGQILSKGTVCVSQCPLSCPGRGARLEGQLRATTKHLGRSSRVDQSFCINDAARSVFLWRRTAGAPTICRERQAPPLL
jgi:hypothetical protein